MPGHDPSKYDARHDIGCGEWKFVPYNIQHATHRNSINLWIGVNIFSQGEYGKGKINYCVNLFSLGEYGHGKINYGVNLFSQGECN